MCCAPLTRQKNKKDAGLLGLGHSLGTQSEQALLGLVELERLGLALSLQLLDGLLVLPADLSITSVQGSCQ